MIPRVANFNRASARLQHPYTTLFCTTTLFCIPVQHCFCMQHLFSYNIVFAGTIIKNNMLKSTKKSYFHKNRRLKVGVGPRGGSVTFCESGPPLDRVLQYSILALGIPQRTPGADSSSAAFSMPAALSNAVRFRSCFTLSLPYAARRRGRGPPPPPPPPAPPPPPPPCSLLRRPRARCPHHGGQAGRGSRAASSR